MMTATATATELQNNFGRLLQEYRSTVCVDAVLKYIRCR